VTQDDAGQRLDLDVLKGRLLDFSEAAYLGLRNLMSSNSRV